MRTIVVVLATIVALAPTAAAELDTKGVRVGPAVMSLNQDQDTTGGQTSESLIEQPGWMAGVYVGWRRSPTFVIQLEGALSNKRLRTEQCPMGACMDTGKISLWYFEIPLLLRLDLLPGSTKFHLDAGPEIVVTLGGGTTDPITNIYSRVDDLLPVNAGVVFGMGFEFSAGPGRITLDLRYQRWFLPLTNSDMGPSGSGNSGREVRPGNQVMIAVGYAFP